MNGQATAGVNEIIQTVLDDGLSLDLRPRDIALLVLIQQKMNSGTGFSFAMEDGELRSLAAKVDGLEVKDSSGTEKRLTESINRLIRANCLARADLSRLRNVEDTEYQLTSLGESIASWHIEHTRFSGEPLAAIEQIAYIGWLGIDYEAITLDKGAFTGLIGPSGAGKSTLTMCLAYAQLPDRRVLDISPISDLQDPHNAGKDSLLGRISPNYGYAYVVLDILTRHGKRLIAGIHAQGEDGRGNLTRFYIDNYPEGTSLQDAFRVSEGDTQYYPDLPDLKRSLAARGYDLHICRQVQDYGQVLYEAGVLPTNLADFSDRSLYSKLIEATYRGGISADVASKLKDCRWLPGRTGRICVSRCAGGSIGRTS